MVLLTPAQQLYLERPFPVARHVSTLFRGKTAGFQSQNKFCILLFMTAESLLILVRVLVRKLRAVLQGIITPLSGSLAMPDHRCVLLPSPLSLVAGTNISIVHGGGALIAFATACCKFVDLPWPLGAFIAGLILPKRIRRAIEAIIDPSRLFARRVLLS